MQELISLPIKPWNGISRCFLSINCSNKMLSLRKLKFSAGKYWLCWDAPSPWENLSWASWLPAGKIFANFIFCLKGEKQIDACFPTASRAGRRKERPIALAVCLPHSVATSAHWAGRDKQRQGSCRAALQNIPKMLLPVSMNVMNVNLSKKAIFKPPVIFFFFFFRRERCHFVQFSFLPLEWICTFWAGPLTQQLQGSWKDKCFWEVYNTLAAGIPSDKQYLINIGQ